MSVERDAQHGDGQDERNGHTHFVFLRIALVHAPDEAGGQQDDVDDDARVERHAQRVDEQQFEPSAHLHDARHDAVEHHGYQHGRADERQQRAFRIGVGHFLIIVHQHDGGQTEQVQQVDADAEARQIGNQDEPAVGVWLVGHVFPLQDEPEHDGGEQRRERIYLALDGREPERVAERVGQRAHYAATHDGGHLSAGDVVFVLHYQLAHQVRDAPEEEQDAGAAHQRAHVVHHPCHFRGAGGEEREEVGHEHEERCSGRVSHFQFITGGDEFRAVPETGGRLDGQAVDRGRDEESNPTCQVVDELVLFHSVV